MERLTELVNNQFFFVVPVAIVIVGFLLVYAFGLKKPEVPQFDKLALVDDRKPAGKKRKIKEKKVANGHATNVADNKHDKSPAKEAKRSPTKEATTENVKQQKEKKQESNATTKQAEKKQMKVKETIEEVKNKKNLKKSAEKPVDYDDGSWETVYSKSDKKNKKNQETTPPPPVKKEKPAKKEKKEELIILNEIEINKSVKDEVNKDLKEKINNEKTIKEKKQTEKVKEIVVDLIPAEDLEKAKKKVKKTKSKDESVAEVVAPKVEKPKKEATKKDEPKNEPTKKEKVVKPEPAIKKDSPKIEPAKKEASPKKETAPTKEDIATLKEPIKKEKKKSEAVLAAESLLNAEKKSETLTTPISVAFDELGDSWTEAKAAKKSKKKARKDN